MTMVETLREGSVPIYLARATGFRPPKWLADWYIQKFIEWIETGRVKKSVVCRGVILDKLEYVLEHGIDVPPGHPLWVDISLEKAWEYGGPRKLLMVLTTENLQTSHLVVPINTPEEQLSTYRKQYQTMVRLEDRGELYLSRLNPSDSRVGSDYEIAHCRFPVADPRSCLVAGIIVLPPDEPSDRIAALIASHKN